MVYVLDVEKEFTIENKIEDFKKTVKI